MNRSGLVLFAGLVSALGVLTPREGRAQTWIQNWTECTPGSFSSCQSLSLETQAVLGVGDVRTGTVITISLHNLQGQGYAYDNTTSSGLGDATFFAPGVSLGSFDNQLAAGVLSGGATGYPDPSTAPTWQESWGSYDLTPSGGTAGGYVGAFAYNLGGYDASLGGCGSAALGSSTYGAFTCTAGSLLTFSFDIGQSLDADQVTAAYIGAYGVNTFQDCYSDPSQYFSNNPKCNVEATSLTQVTPEPATLTLLATGLLGIGGAGFRRRKRMPD